MYYPFKAAAKNYGRFDSFTAFCESVLEEKTFATLVLKPDLVTQLTQQLGSLAHGEVYIPTPYPFLSRGAPTSYDKGSWQVMLAIVGQFMSG